MHGCPGARAACPFTCTLTCTHPSSSFLKWRQVHHTLVSYICTLTYYIWCLLHPLFQVCWCAALLLGSGLFVRCMLYAGADSRVCGERCSALQEVKIPPGPRLLILHHLERYRHVLKPGMPPPLYPGAAAPQQRGQPGKQ